MFHRLHHLHRPHLYRLWHERDTWRQQNMVPNDWTESWIEFFRDRRVLHIARQAFEVGRLPADVYARVERVAERLDEWLYEPKAGSLVHGDVWPYNVLVKNDRVAAFIDPAIFYADPEFDVALAARAGFGRPFNERYNKLRPLKPGFDEGRRWLYPLVPILNGILLYGMKSPVIRSNLDKTLEHFGC